ncbi:DEAD/DEAH box helicase [Bernardetia sp.]|uniref:DEAD/DEAH box helicase n=1 Tax=Bernardetia sp. TaxID=1937974 RepID=UPI0025BDA72A|nr:DEAD/DEAH box helicase [Bernardetia sp.]
MSNSIKNQKAILAKLGIEKLNEMQEESKLAMDSANEVVLLSPTGTGKTIAFLLPIIEKLDADVEEIQALIVVPTRELAIQIEQVMRQMGTGFKVNAVYGGRAGSKDKIEIKHRPAVLIGTMGRVADHLRRKTFSTHHINTLVLDEFDKSLEIGFEEEMKEILELLPKVNKKILTSATKGIEIPSFVGLRKPLIIDYLDDKKRSKLEIKLVESPKKDKLDMLLELLSYIGNQNGIVFCNYKDSIERISNFLSENSISHGTFFGGMEQTERERALIKFRNGTHQILLATDLAARGIDVPELSFIIHYHLPHRSEEFTHRNGRTARMDAKGTAYILHYENENLPDFIEQLNLSTQNLVISTKQNLPKISEWTTLFISGGRKDKISKGDIAGLFFKQGKLEKNELGIIELKNDCAFVAVKKNTIKTVLPKVNNQKLKKKKVRVSVV